ncbi:MAG: insulinase family protein [Sphingomonadaceae bacterium]|nr:insulinase family protein [Sphingomonadaceae bacterium]
MKFLRLFPLLLLAQPLPALAQHAEAPPKVTPASAPDWGFEDSDIPLDPAWIFGELDNGMRYAIRQNATPAGAALVRLRINSGSLEEQESERGLAHFLEHMAFNGSARVPEGEMIKLLEREGLAFGADTNASTGFTATTYKLDLPRNTPELLDTALMLMRETASELTIAPDAVDRERGVMLAERRDRRNYSLTETEDRIAFLTPNARYGQRLPIGLEEVLQNASAADIRGYYKREYVPANAVLVVVGDFDPALVEAAIRKHFASWSPAPMPPEPDAGPVKLDREGEVDIYLDPALTERLQLSRHLPYVERPDSAAVRQQKLLATIGYAIINRRFATLARSEDPPFRSAGFGTADVFEAGRTTNLIIDTPDNEWREGLLAAIPVWRRAMTYGFTEAEVAEQVAGIRSGQENAARGEATRNNASWEADVFALVDDGTVPSTAASSLERFNAFAPAITPASVLAALRADAHPLDNPLIRFRGRNSPEGGEAALQATLAEAMAIPIEPLSQEELQPFAYSDFGTPGTVVEDRVDSRLGIRTVRFANGVRLNLKRTDLEQDRIRYRVQIDGGTLLDTRENPLATAMVSVLPVGGLGQHTQDELATILAGRNVSFNITTDGDVFTLSGTTTPRDLELQLQLATAGITDPGYRKQGEVRFRRSVANFFASKDATPGKALGNALGGIVSDSDPRFSLASKQAFDALDFAQLKAVIGDRLAAGAIEIGLVGDLDEDEAIALVAETFGTLPPREVAFQPREEARQRSFTVERGRKIIYHDGEPDQALLSIVWPTADDSDLRDVARMELLERVVRLILTDVLREKLGKAYSPGASSSMSRTWRDYGTFSISASVDVSDVDPTSGAIRAAITSLRDAPIDADMLERARRPVLESYDNALKSNGGWLALVDRAQSESYRIDRFLALRAIYESLTPEDIQAAAQQYLDPEAAVEVVVLPRPAGE